MPRGRPGQARPGQAPTRQARSTACLLAPHALCAALMQALCNTHYATTHRNASLGQLTRPGAWCYTGHTRTEIEPCSYSAGLAQLWRTPQPSVPTTSNRVCEHQSTATPYVCTSTSIRRNHHLIVTTTTSHLVGAGRPHMPWPCTHDARSCTWQHTLTYCCTTQRCRMGRLVAIGVAGGGVVVLRLVTALLRSLGV